MAKHITEIGTFPVSICVLGIIMKNYKWSLFLTRLWKFQGLCKYSHHIIDIKYRLNILVSRNWYGINVNFIHFMIHTYIRFVLFLGYKFFYPPLMTFVYNPLYLNINKSNNISLETYPLFDDFYCQI